MKISYDPEVDALYIQFQDTTVITQHIAEGIAIDYDQHGRIAGIEILDAKKRLSSAIPFDEIVIESLMAKAGTSQQ
ncbi:MAG: DUF2283 domain-containing protein [Desulfurococcaceae archaeon]